MTIGRGEHNDFELGWDAEVSRTHAQLVLVGGEWTLVDDGLSRNGSFLNGERIHGRRRLADGDVIRLGRTSIVFRAPGLRARSTAVGDLAPHVRLTDGERRVLVALCRPAGRTRAAPGIPAGNREIAAELHLSADGVKTHIRSLFAKLGIEDLPQYRKRTELARRALESGLVTPRELGSVSAGVVVTTPVVAVRARGRSMLSPRDRRCPSPCSRYIPPPVASCAWTAAL